MSSLIEKLRAFLRLKPRTPEDQLKEAERLARQRDFELTKARYRN